MRLRVRIPNCAWPYVSRTRSGTREGRSDPAQRWFSSFRSGIGNRASAAALGLALGDEQALSTYANRTVEVAQHAGGQANATARDGRLGIQANPLAYGLAV